MSLDEKRLEGVLLAMAVLIWGEASESQVI